MKKSKVFGIGLFKTGTTSLGDALKILGYNHVNLWSRYTNVYDYKNQTELLNKLSDEYDSFEDYPWMYCYKEMSEKYKDAKFILTLRKEELYRKSEIKVRLREGWTMEESIRDVEENIIPRYYKHLEDVRNYFNGSKNYLEVDFSKGDGWIQICNFLEEKIPDIDFPHSNKNTMKL